MTTLSVNVNKVALLRNSRNGTIPCPLRASALVLEAGATGVTVHPRPDQRHIRPEDVRAIAQLLKDSRWQKREFNIEGNPFEGDYMTLVRDVRPTQCTLVPDAPGQATSDHGWDIQPHREKLKQVIDQLHQLGCRVSLFMDPDPMRIEQVPATGADRIELYTEAYAQAFAQGGELLQITHEQYDHAARTAHELGLGINAGHDLNLHNLSTFVTIANILEVSIGHALIADALELGISATVKAYLKAIANPTPL